MSGRKWKLPAAPPFWRYGSAVRAAERRGKCGAARVAKVLIEDENPVLRLGLEALLGAVPGLEVVRGSGEPDVVVLGAAVPPLGEIAGLAGGPRIVVVTSA